MLTCSGCRVGSFCSADHHKMASESIKATLGGNLMLGHPLINTHLPSVSSLVCLGRGVVFYVIDTGSTGSRGRAWGLSTLRPYDPLTRAGPFEVQIASLPVHIQGRSAISRLNPSRRRGPCTCGATPVAPHMRNIFLVCRKMAGGRSFYLFSKCPRHHTPKLSRQS